MQPSKGRFVSGGYSDYSALQQDAAQRLMRMEQRARDAVGGKVTGEDDTAGRGAQASSARSGAPVSSAPSGTFVPSGAWVPSVPTGTSLSSAPSGSWVSSAPSDTPVSSDPLGTSVSSAQSVSPQAQDNTESPSDAPKSPTSDGAGLSRNVRSQPARSQAPFGAGDIGGELGEQVFLLLLIYLLVREKGDPCLIAALLYILL